MSSQPETESWSPTRPPDGECWWRWQPDHLADLAWVRRDLRAGLARRPRSRAADDDGLSDAIVMVVDELASNALRHGRPPVVVVVCRTSGAWLLEVCDRAVETPPRRAVGRDPAMGGMGLGIVADIASECGWSWSPAGKVVWAVVPDPA